MKRWKRRNMKTVSLLLVLLMTLSSPLSIFAAETEDASPETEVTVEVADDETAAKTETDDEEAADAAGDPEDVIMSYDETESAVENELPDTVPGMPEGFILSETEKEIKQDAAAHDIAGQMNDYIEGRDYIENEVFCMAESEEYGQMVAEAYGAKLKEYTYGVAIIDLTSSGLSVADAVALGQNLSNDLPVVEPNYIYEVEPGTDTDFSEFLASRPDAPLSTGWEDWYYSMANPDPLLRPDDPNYQWWHDMIDSYGAWGMLNNTSLTSGGIKVAVIDTGVSITHEELSGHVTQYDIAGGKAAPASHGSHVAGIVSASADNGKGGAGVAPGVNIMALCCANSDGRLNGAYINTCIMFAADNGADIINMSLGGPSYSPEQFAAVKHAYEKGVTICASTGNDNANAVKYPAAYTGTDDSGKKIDYVIGVSAVRQDGEIATFSTFGNDVTDISAPGAEMVSSVTGGPAAYEKWDGTSMACPVVAGACALYMSVMGHVDPATMESVLKKSAVRSRSEGSGAGILNVAGMFDGDTTVPRIELKLKDDTSVGYADKDSKSGKTVIADAVPKSAKIYIYPENYDKKPAANAHTHLVYTVDGKSPSVKNNEVVYGNNYTGVINVRDLIGDATTPVTLSVKALAVTGTGVVGKVSTLTFTVDPQALGNETVTILNAPASVVAGKSVTLQAEVTSDEAESVPQNVKWTVSENTIGVTIREKTGVLSTKANKTGTVTVTCTTEDGKASANVNVNIVAASTDKNALVNTITLSDKTKNLLLGKGDGVVNLTSLKNKAGDDLKGTVKVLWSSSNSAVAIVKPSIDGTNAVIVPKTKGSAVITAKAMDGSEKSATVKVTVAVPVSNVKVDGQDYIVPGSKASYKAVSVVPKNAGNKNVIWTFDDGTVEKDGGKVTINPKGVVNVLLGASEASYTVRAAAADNGGAYGDHNFTVKNAKASSVTVSTAATDPAYQIVTKNGTLNTAQLFTVNAVSSNVDERQLSVTGTVDNGIAPKWTSSKPGIVEIEGAGNNVKLVAKSVGTSKITCTANDGSKKSTSFTVKVVVPVSSLLLSNPTIVTEPDPDCGLSYAVLAYGASNQTKAVLGDAYGKPTNTKVKWDYRIVRYYFTNPGQDDNRLVIEELSEDAGKALKDSKLYTFKNGKITVNKQFEKIFANKNLSVYDSECRFAVIMKATATDGTEVSVEKVIVPTAPISWIWFKYRLYTGPAQTDEMGNYISNYLGTINFKFGVNGHYNENIPGFKVVSSNPAVANGFAGIDDTMVPVIDIAFGKPGSAKLKVIAADGTNKSTSISIRVTR